MGEQGSIEHGREHALAALYTVAKASDALRRAEGAADRCVARSVLDRAVEQAPRTFWSLVHHREYAIPPGVTALAERDYRRYRHEGWLALADFVDRTRDGAEGRSPSRETA